VDLDDALINALRDDARMSVSALADRIGAPRAAVSTRLERLRADGSVSVLADVHPEFLGLTAFAHLAVRTSGPASAVAERIAGMRAAAFVSAVSGVYQLIAELRLPGQPELYAAIAEIRGIRHVERVNALLYVDVLKGTFMTGRSLPAGLRLDDRDLALIELLRSDGRASFASLASAVGLSPSAARTRVGALVADEVVRIAPVISRTRPDAGVIAGVGLNVRGRGEEIVDSLAADQRVEYLARTIGRYDVIATVASRTPGELDGFLERLTVSGEIANIESWVHLRVVKERYEWPLPGVSPRVRSGGRAATPR
jgi:Transcriptional regulators